MIEKLALAFSKLRGEVQALSQRIDSLPEPKNGRDGVSPKAEDIAALVLEQIPAPKDGVSPKAEDIAALVLEQIPVPKDGKDADAQAIIEEVLAQIPAPKDGKDAQPPALADVAALVFAQMPKPKDGRDGKDGKSPTAQEVAAALPAPERGPQGKEGRPGKDGVSVTDVKVEKNNTLFVWLDGKKKRAGKIEVPVPSVPQFAAGGGSRGSRGPEAKTVGYTPQGTFVSGDLQPGALDTPQTVTFGAGGTTDDGGATIGADGVITVNDDGFWSVKQRFRAGRTGASGVSILFFWAEVSADGGATWNIIGNSVSIPLESSNDTSVFFDLANLQVPAGTKLRNRFARSSTGDNSGDLRVGVPSAALQAAGVPDAPSAQATFYKIIQ